MLPKLLPYILLLSFLNIKVIAQPEWVNSKPSNPQFYYGIGSCLVSDSIDYKSVAKNSALNDLASEIFINLVSELSIQTAEKLGLVESEVKSIIKANTQAELEGYELAGEWQGDNRFWSFYKLSKDLFQKIKEDKKSAAIKSSIDYLTKSKSFIYPDNISEILSYKVFALKALDKYLTENIKVNINGQESLIINDIVSQIQTILNDIAIEPIEKTMNVKYGKSINRKIGFSTKLKQGNNLVLNIPIRFFFEKGSGIISNMGNSGISGIASTDLFSLTSFNKTQLLKAKLDLFAYINFDTSSVLLNKVLNSLLLPSDKVELKVAGIKAVVSSNEVNLGETLKMNLIEPKLKNLLSNKGFLFIDNEKEADFKITIDASTRQGSELYGQFTALLDINISVHDITSDEEIYKENKQNIKGIMLDYNGAGLNAYQNSNKILGNEIIPAMIKKIESLN